ncbi:MAG: hypothetical protein ACYC6Z_08110 [Thermoleophilia bacterium]
MFKIALIGTVSVILLLAAGTIASAKGIGPASGGNGHAVNDAAIVGRMTTGQTAAGGTAMPATNGTMAGYVVAAANQMSSARAAQMAAAAQTHMQQATGTDPGYGMQSGGAGTGYMGTGTGGTATGGSMMGPSTTGTTTGNTGSTTHMGTTGDSTTRAGSGSMMTR